MMAGVARADDVDTAAITAPAHRLVEAINHFTDGGKRIHQTGQWVINVKKVGDEWLIDGHAFAITSESEAK